MNSSSVTVPLGTRRRAVCCWLVATKRCAKSPTAAMYQACAQSWSSEPRPLMMSGRSLLPVTVLRPRRILSDKHRRECYGRQRERVFLSMQSHCISLEADALERDVETGVPQPEHWRIARAFSSGSTPATSSRGRQLAAAQNQRCALAREETRLTNSPVYQPILRFLAVYEIVSASTRAATRVDCRSSCGLRRPRSPLEVDRAIFRIVDRHAVHVRRARFVETPFGAPICPVIQQRVQRRWPFRNPNELERPARSVAC